MFYASRLAGQRGEAEKASALLQDSLRLFRQGADMPGEIFALSHLGIGAATTHPGPRARGDASRHPIPGHARSRWHCHDVHRIRPAEHTQVHRQRHVEARLELQLRRFREHR